jgi:hypothetical protein
MDCCLISNNQHCDCIYTMNVYNQLTYICFKIAILFGIWNKPLYNIYYGNWIHFILLFNITVKRPSGKEEWDCDYGNVPFVVVTVTEYLYHMTMVILWSFEGPVKVELVLPLCNDHVYWEVKFCDHWHTFVSKCFFSETTWTVETKLPRNDHWKVLYKVYVFYFDRNRNKKP